MAVQRIRLDPAIEEELANEEEHNEAMVQEDWSRMAAAVQRVIGRALVAAPTSIDELSWEGYFVIDEDPMTSARLCSAVTKYGPRTLHAEAGGAENVRTTVRFLLRV